MSAATNSASATKSRSETASSEFSNGRRELERARDRRGIEGQARTRERARAERRHVGTRETVVPAVDVARQRPEVREQMMREQHRLRALQVRVAGQARSRSTPPRAAAAPAAARGCAPRPRDPRAAGTDAGRARPGRCGCGRCAASRPTVPAISVTRRSIAVWMSSSVGANTNGRRRAPPRPESSAAITTPRSSSVSRPDPGQHLHVRARAGEVVGGEAAIEREADGEREQLVGRTLAEAAVPERPPARRLVLGSRRSRDPGGATTSRPKGPTAGRSPRSPGGGTRRRRRRSRGRGRRGRAARAGRPGRTARARAAAGPRRSRAPGSTSTNAASARISGVCHMPS